MTEKKRPTLDELLEQLDEPRVDVDWRSDDSDHVPSAPLAGVDLLAQLRRHRFRRLSLAVPDGHALLWFDVFPLAGALVLVDAPLWVCRWQSSMTFGRSGTPINGGWTIYRWRRSSGCLVVTW